MAFLWDIFPCWECTGLILKRFWNFLKGGCRRLKGCHLVSGCCICVWLILWWVKTFVDCIVDQDDLTNLLWMWQNRPLVFFFELPYAYQRMLCLYMYLFISWLAQAAYTYCNSPEVFLGWRKSNQDNTVFCWIHEWTTMRNNDQQLPIGQCPELVYAPTFQWSLEVRGIRDALWSVALWLVEHLKIAPIQLRPQTQAVCGCCLFMFVWVCLSIFVWHMGLIHMFVSFVQCCYMRSWIGVEKNKVYWCLLSYPYTNWKILTCWRIRNDMLKHAECFVFYHTETLYGNMNDELCPVCFQHCLLVLMAKSYMNRKIPTCSTCFNHLENIWIACFLEDFQHGILHPWNPRGCHFQVILRRPPPLREEVRFLGTLGRLPINWGYGRLSRRLKAFQVGAISMPVMCKSVDVNELENGNNKEIFQERYFCIVWVTQITGCKVPCDPINI